MFVTPDLKFAQSAFSAKSLSTKTADFWNSSARSCCVEDAEMILALGAPGKIPYAKSPVKPRKVTS